MRKVVCHDCGESVLISETIQRWAYEGDTVAYGDLFAINKKPNLTLRKVRICKFCQ